jgi:hypothetical protein
MLFCHPHLVIILIKLYKIFPQENVQLYKKVKRTTVLIISILHNCVDVGEY